MKHSMIKMLLPSKVKVRAAPGQTNAADKKKNGKKEKKELWSRVKGSRKEGFWYEICLV